MCRLLGYAATSSKSFDQVVGDTFLQFKALAKDHCDGWGLTTAESSAAYKEVTAANKSASFDDQISAHKSTSALLHLRWATSGMEVNQDNTHPFSYKDISFIHNGSLTPPTCLDDQIDPNYLILIKGTTDSERYFYFLLSSIDKHGFLAGVKAGLTYIKNNCQFTSINMMMLNPNYFLTACIYNQDKIPEKFKDQTDYYQLKFTKKVGQIISASSGWDQVGWSDIPNGHLLVLDRKTQVEQLVKV